jgi:hypothetical protein
MAERPSRTILANIVSDIMAEHPTDAYRRAMAAVTPRKLWQAEPGDCVVMLAPCTPAFREYVESVTGLDTSQVDIVAPEEVRGVHALDVVRDLGAEHLLASRPELQPFVPDRPVLEFGRRTGVRVLPYTKLPGGGMLDALRLINTKRGFRETAAGLGLPVAEGGYAESQAELVSSIKEFLTTRPAAIIKNNRSSNGFGNVVIRSGGPKTPEEQLAEALAGQAERDGGWVYEEFLPFTATPSIEMNIDDAGPTYFYSCDQRTVNNAWTGMVTPAEEGPFHKELMRAAEAIGGWLHSHGYRGIFDVDCGVHEGGYVVTEANVRRTGGTYLEELARRMRPGDSPVHWRADVRLSTGSLDFASAVARLASAGLADSSSAARVLLTADTRAVDGKWRYLVVGRDAQSVAEVERQAEIILGIG